MKRIIENLRLIEEEFTYPDLMVCSSAPEPETIMDGKRILMFSSNNYLGLATHPDVKRLAKEAIDKYGIGSGGSRILSGNYDIHQKLEKALASFKGGEDAMVFPCGFSTNLGVIPAIMNLFGSSILSIFMKRFTERNIIFSDEFNHASIIDGCRASKIETAVYKHCDMQDLEKKFKKYKGRRKLIITDTIFSMDGDIPPLDQIVALAKQYNALTMVDEAHATGVFGERGAGIVEQFNLTGQIDIIMGTLSKALGSLGGFIVGNKKLIRFLRVATRSYMFSTSLPPVLAAAALSSIDIIKNNPNLRKNLFDNVNYFRKKVNTLGFNTLNSKTQIIPLLVGEEDKAIKMGGLLFKNNIFAPCARWPAVPKGLSRIRISIMATHTKDQIDYLISKCEEIGKILKII